jgi:hypothetical protein
MTGPSASGQAATGLGRLRQLATPAPPEPEQEEPCEFCGVPLGERHGHVADTAEHRLLCVCRPCYLLFAPEGAGGGRFRAVGEDVRRVSDLCLDDVTWDSLRVPVDLVFFFRQRSAEEEPARLLAFYPGPGGATESELDLAAWDHIVTTNPVLDQIAPDVEAVLLRRRDGAFSAHLVPIDVCYELVGVVRSSWKGLGGGPEVWARMAAYFDDLDRRGREVHRSGAA